MENYHILKIEPVADLTEENVDFKSCSANMLINYAYKFKSKNFIKKILQEISLTEKELAVVLKAVRWTKEEFLCISQKNSLVLYNYFIRYGELFLLTDDLIVYCMKYLPEDLKNIFNHSLKTYHIGDKLISKLTYEEVCSLIKHNSDFKGYDYERVKNSAGAIKLKDVNIFQFYEKYQQNLFLLNDNDANFLMEYILNNLSSYEGMEDNYAKLNIKSDECIIFKPLPRHVELKNYASIIKYLLEMNHISDNLKNEANIILGNKFTIPQYILYENYIDGFKNIDFLHTLIPYTLRKERELQYALENYSLDRKVLHEIAYLNIQYRQMILNYLKRDDKEYDKYIFNIISRKCEPLCSLKNNFSAVDDFYARQNNFYARKIICADEKNYAKNNILHKNNLNFEKRKKIKEDFNFPIVTYELVDGNFTNIKKLYGYITSKHIFDRFLTVVEHTADRKSILKILTQFIFDDQKIYLVEKKYTELYSILAKAGKIKLADIPSDKIKSCLNYFSFDEILNFDFNFFIENFYEKFFNDFQFTETEYENKFYCKDNCTIVEEYDYINILQSGPSKKAFMLNNFIYAKNYAYDLHKYFFNRECINHKLILILGKFSVDECIKYLQEVDFGKESRIILNKLEYLFFNNNFKINDDLKNLNDLLNEYHFFKTDFKISLLKNKCESVGDVILQIRKFSKKYFMEGVEQFEQTGHILFKKNILKYFNFYVKEFQYTEYEFLYFAVLYFNEVDELLRKEMGKILRLYDNREQIDAYISKWKNNGKVKFADKIMQILK